MGAEYERKYRAQAEQLAAVAGDYPGKWETLHMQTTYYDTPSAALSSRRYMLRTRRENELWICTLKTPGDGMTRGEWELAEKDIMAAIPVLCKLGAPAELVQLCAEGLIPLCGAEFTRRALLLELPGCTAELALDQGRLLGKAGKAPLCEIELELKEGSREALDAFARTFAETYGLQPEAQSKFARALALNNEV